MSVNSLPKRRDCDLTPCHSAPESSTLTTRLPSNRCTLIQNIKIRKKLNFVKIYRYLKHQGCIVLNKWATSTFTVAMFQSPSSQSSYFHTPACIQAGERPQGGNCPRGDTQREMFYSPTARRPALSDSFEFIGAI